MTGRELTTPTLHRGWQEWIAESLIQGLSASRIADALADHGFERDYVLAHVREAEASPVMTAARKVAKRAVKRASLLEALGELYRQSNVAEEFGGPQVICGEEFYSRYFYGNRPVLVDGLMRNWPALDLWSPHYFADEFGDVEVEITHDRGKDPRYEDNFADHRAMVKMRDYVRMIEEGGETNDYYLVAKNQLLERPECACLMAHFSSPDRFLDPTIKTEGYVKLWFGPKGTVTPLHHDATNIFFGQIYGRKQIKLISPYHIDRVYNDRTCFSAVDPEDLDLTRFPLMQQVPIIDVIVHPGQFLFLPIGWWHWVKALDTSISLSFQNFYFRDGSIVWRNCY